MNRTLKWLSSLVIVPLSIGIAVLTMAACGSSSSSVASYDGTRSTVDTAGSGGKYNSVAIGADGLPIISYYEAPVVLKFRGSNLKAAPCQDPACTAASVAVVDSGPDKGVGEHTSIAMGLDGLPIISYYNGINRDLKVAHCHEPAGTAASLTTVDSAGEVGEYTSIAIGEDGLPVVSYYEGAWQYTKNELKVAHCSNPTCAGR